MEQKRMELTTILQVLKTLRLTLCVTRNSLLAVAPIHVKILQTHKLVKHSSQGCQQRSPRSVEKLRLPQALWLSRYARACCMPLKRQKQQNGAASLCRRRLRSLAEELPVLPASWLSMFGRA